MFITALKSQFQNAILLLTSYMLVIVLGLLVGTVVSFLNGVEEALAVYTTVSVPVVTAVAMTVVKIFGGLLGK